jgi:hypothetical protein
LQELANSSGSRNFLSARTVLKVVVPAYVDPVFGTYQLGDDARIIITDSRFPNTLDEIYRIVGLTVEPGEDGPERVTLTLAQGAVNHKCHTLTNLLIYKESLKILMTD